jgi:hypothetical protein
MCDHIFDELLNLGNIKISHTFLILCLHLMKLNDVHLGNIKFCNSYSHATNNCIFLLLDSIGHK